MLVVFLAKSSPVAFLPSSKTEDVSRTDIPDRSTSFTWSASNPAMAALLPSPTGQRAHGIKIVAQVDIINIIQVLCIVLFNTVLT